jgi:hypothetical protein
LEFKPGINRHALRFKSLDSFQKAKPIALIGLKYPLLQQHAETESDRFLFSIPPFSFAGLFRSESNADFSEPNYDNKFQIGQLIFDRSVFGQINTSRIAVASGGSLAGKGAGTSRGVQYGGGLS